MTERTKLSRSRPGECSTTPRPPLMSMNTLDRMIADDLMPGPIQIYSRTLWDVRALDSAIDALPSNDWGDEVNDWNEVL